MAIIFHDTFVGTAGQDLVVRTPDTVGTSWAETRSHAALQEIDVSGRADTTAAQLDGHHVYRGRPNPTSAEYDVIGTVSSVSAVAQKSWFVVGRYADVNNSYGYQLAGNIQKLYKRVGGITTELATLSEAYAANDVLLLQVRNAAKKCFRNGVEKLTSADNALPAAGEAGFGLGNVFVSTNDIETAWDTTEFKVDEVGAAAATPVWEFRVPGYA